MPALQVRDLPQDLYDRLVELSRRDHRSIAQETTFIIEEYCSDAYATLGYRKAGQRIPSEVTAQRESYMQRRRLIIDRVAKLPHFEVPEGFPPTASILAEEREAR